VIEPANPQVVYVPEYDPWLVYGEPLVAWPGWYPYPGLYLSGPGIVFGLGFEPLFFGGFGWGWNNWGFDWHHRNIIYNHNTYISHSRNLRQSQQLQFAGVWASIVPAVSWRKRISGPGRGRKSGIRWGFEPQHGSVAPHPQPGYPFRRIQRLLIMEEPREDSRLAEDRASVEVSTEVGAFTEAEVFTVEVTGNSVPLPQKTTDDREKEMMRTTNMKLGTFRLRLARMIALAVLPLLIVGSARSSLAQTSNQKRSRHRERLVMLSFRLSKREDEQTLKRSSEAGDRSHFFERRSRGQTGTRAVRPEVSGDGHRLVREPDGRTVLYIGGRKLAFPHPFGLKERCLILRFRYR